MKMNIKKGDKVKVISGKDKGKTGVVLAAFPQSQRISVEGVAMIKKAVRPTQANPSGGITTKEGTIHVSNAMLVCPKCNAATRISMKGTGREKTRICKKCGAQID